MNAFRRVLNASVLAALLGLAAACATAGDPLVPGPEREAVDLDEMEVRALAQILGYEDRRSYDADAFERFLDGSVEVRRRAVVAAGRIGDPAAAGLVARVLDDDPSTTVRADAAFALGVLGDTSRMVLASLREAVPAGWVPPRAAETTVVVEVVHALGKLASDPARAMVVDALRSAHPGQGENARRVAAEALLNIWRFDQGPGRVNGVVRYIDSPHAALRWRAAYALMRLREPEGAPALLTLLGDEDHRARASAARGLSATIADSAGIRDTAIVALAAALTDAHPHVRINAVGALAGYGDAAPVEAMARLLADPDAHVAAAAAGALAAFPERARDALVAAVHDDALPHAVRAAAARTVGAVAPEAVAGELRAWSQGAFPARYAAARSLAWLDRERAEPMVRTLADDPDRRVAVAARVAAAALADSGELGDLPEPHDPVAPPDRVPDGSRTAAFYEEIVRTYLVPALSGERPRAVIRTPDGDIVVELLAEEAPLTVHNFVTLARGGYWDDGVWHRVVPNFVLQDGAPAGDPDGGPGWRIRDEINRVRYTRGVMGMALSGPDTGGSQWFITHSPQHHLDGGYTIFGRVIDGMDVADTVLQGDPIEAIRIPQ